MNTGERHWLGLLSVYVDDLLVAAEDDAAMEAMKAIEKIWAISDVEVSEAKRSIKYCGFEIDVPPDGDGFIVRRKKYEQELMMRWKVSEKVALSGLQNSGEEEQIQQYIEQKEMKETQAFTGAQLWLSTRTRPHPCKGVAAVSRLVARNPLKAVQIGHILLEYVNGNPDGLSFYSGGDPWGKRDQLKTKKDEKLIEIYANIAYTKVSKGWG